MSTEGTNADGERRIYEALALDIPTPANTVAKAFAF
jgi:hypothetical protein